MGSQTTDTSRRSQIFAWVRRAVYLAVAVAIILVAFYFDARTTSADSAKNEQVFHK